MSRGSPIERPNTEKGESHVCTYCGRDGHSVNDCRTRARAISISAKLGASPPADPSLAVLPPPGGAPAAKYCAPVSEQVSSSELEDDDIAAAIQLAFKDEFGDKEEDGEPGSCTAISNFARVAKVKQSARKGNAPPISSRLRTSRDNQNQSCPRQAIRRSSSRVAPPSLRCVESSITKAIGEPFNSWVGSTPASKLIVNEGEDPDSVGKGDASLKLFPQKRGRKCKSPKVTPHREKSDEKQPPSPRGKEKVKWKVTINFQRADAPTQPGEEFLLSQQNTYEMLVLHTTATPTLEQFVKKLIPALRPTHAFSNVRVGEASNPGPRRGGHWKNRGNHIPYLVDR